MLMEYSCPEHHVANQRDDERFTDDEEDATIIETLATDDPKPVFITADVNMYTRRPNERKALASSGLTCVFIRKHFTELEIHVQALKILKVWPDVIEATSRCSQPTAFEITTNAKVKKLCPTKDLMGMP